MSTALSTLTSNMAQRFNMGAENANELMATLKQTAFKGQVSDAQMTALMLVAQQYGLNPWTREIYAFPDRQNGIVPVVGVDGWSRIINDHPQFDGMDYEQDAESCTCTIYRKDRSHPVRVTEWMDECKRDGVGPWKSHPKRMLRHKATIQCARLAFGFAGIFDQDEAERISESDRQKPSNVPQAPKANTSFLNTWLPVLNDAAELGTDSLTKAFNSIPQSPDKKALWVNHGVDLKKKAKIADDSILPESE